ncbi:PaREP1 domain containing protein [Thermoproteus uzoniensis 768-20]|uniref:PaREP1 domain containing protein n=1 Tax=Thermoproteus uzoniensis (strain 768-20) TaxID=999630 RepID=F2L0C8_THEU7|nr:PaREP1 family protein [Thermoproteus uzoniensis]AEA12610.1 PaREP1 domain containing protein [Thermoproteus uzoniensis 768-20]
MELSKPWRDPGGYRRGRLLEAKYEAELALRFLEQGLYRNAAGKAFQAWKAFLAAVAVDHVGLLAERFRGTRTTREGRRVRLADFIAAFMPTGYMLAAAAVLEEASGLKLADLTNVALNLHEFQYNGLDKSGTFSRYPSLELVEADVKRLANAVLELVSKLEG